MFSFQERDQGEGISWRHRISKPQSEGPAKSLFSAFKSEVGRCVGGSVLLMSARFGTYSMNPCSPVRFTVRMCVKVHICSISAILLWVFLIQ